MPLVTANQYDLVPQFSNLGSGFQQGQQIGNQFKQGRIQDQQLAAEKARQQTISQFSPQALQGDQAALDKVAAVDPGAAIDFQKLFAGKKEAEIAEDLRENKVLTQTALNAMQLPPEKRRAFLLQKREEFKANGRDTSNTDRALAADDATMNQMIEMQAMKGLALDEQAARAFPDLMPKTAQEREFDQLSAGLSEEDKLKARRIELGLDPRAVGSATQTITETGKASDIAKTEATIEGAREEAKLIEQKKLKPEIEAAVIKAVSQAKADAESIAEDKSGSKTLNVYETAMSGLVSSLGNTATGPFVGWTPALTSNQQIAEGAVAAMAPVLKQLFRSAGEGIFTDKDQELLMRMVPTRSDSKDAIAAKLSNIDAIVRAKLRSSSKPPADPAKATSGRFQIEVIE